MKLQSCQNCWFNGLQYGAIGLPVGYCARHRKVLNSPDETTCGQQIRKDLGLKRAQEVATYHAKAYENDKIVRLSSKEEVNGDSSSALRDLAVLRRDLVGEVVVEFGSLDTTILSLVELKTIRTTRSDIAMISLGRAYIRNCMQHEGVWTSGLHLYWWTRKRLAEVPTIEVDDLRYVGAIQLSRQTELAKWSIMMFRMSLLDDIAEYAGPQNKEVGQEIGIANSAAMAVQDFDVWKLSKWIRKELIPALESKMNYERYLELGNKLKKIDNQRL